MRRVGSSSSRAYSTPAPWRTYGTRWQAPRARMLRELAEGLEALTAERPVVLVLEDLHWSDPSTVEALALLARRRDPARLLVLGTYRPVELILHDHPLKMVKQELAAHGQCVDMLLSGLSPQAVTAYVAQRGVGRAGGA